MSLPLILAMDTATRCSTVALTRGNMEEGEVLAEMALSSSITHSRRLIDCLDHLLKHADITLQEVDGIAVGLGPGSFTGLRIGVATAKGLAVASDKKLLGVSTLDSIAVGCGVTAKKICVVVDARKKQVYTAFYTIDQRGGACREGAIKVLSPQQLAEEIEEPVIMVGDGVVPFRDFWQDSLGELVQFGPTLRFAPSASAIGLLCGDLYDQGSFLDVLAAGFGNGS